MPTDPRRLFDAKDMAGAILYAKRLASSDDAYPVLVNSDGSLIVSITSGTIAVSVDTTGLATSAGQTTGNLALEAIRIAVTGQLTIGTVTLASTSVTINNDIANPVNVSLASTVVSVTLPPALSITSSTINNAVGNPVNVSLTSTVVSVTLPPSLSTTAVTINNLSGNPVNVSSTNTSSTINNAVGNPVNISLTSTVVTISNTAGTVTNSVSTIVLISKTLTGSTGSLAVTNGTISVTPSGRIKVYAFSLTTTSATEVTCVFHSGSVANGLELWRATLMAPTGANSGANLAVAPPGFLFASRSGTAVSLSLSTAVLVHYSISYYDEA